MWYENGEKNMEIIERGMLSDENLRHPISAYYLHGTPSGEGVSDLLLSIFGFMQ
jgi:hypothetical protein